MGTHGCKVCRVLQQRGMDRYEEVLLDRWTAEPPERMGYRKLARWLNVAMLQLEMDRAGVSTIGGAAEACYDLLRGSDAMADEVAESLTDTGIDASQLTDDFVSYGVVRTHLKECLGAERETKSGSWERDAIDISFEHARTKLGEAIRSLQNKGELSAGGEISVHVGGELECDD